MNERDDGKCKQALAAILEEVLKLIARHDAPPDVQQRYGIIESICRHGADVRTSEQKRDLPKDDDLTIS